MGRTALLWASPTCLLGSATGKRRGATDERDGWPVTLDAIDACQPTRFLAQNVRGWSYHMDL